MGEFSGGGMTFGHAQANHSNRYFETQQQSSIGEGTGPSSEQEFHLSGDGKQSLNDL